MPIGTTTTEKDGTSVAALKPSGTEGYDPKEAERAQNDLACRALQYAKDCGATIPWPPPCDLENILRSEFWFFIYNAGVHRHTFEGPAHRIEDSKRKLSELVKGMLALVELFRNESYVRALDALCFENWLVQRSLEAEPIAGTVVAERVRQCLELLLGPLEHAFERARGGKGAAHGDRNKLTRWALEQPENSGGWWPANPTDEDLTALSVLTGVYLQNFEDDFDNRQELVDEAGGAETTQLKALWRRERKRFGEVRKSSES